MSLCSYCNLPVLITAAAFPREGRSPWWIWRICKRRRYIISVYSIYRIWRSRKGSWVLSQFFDASGYWAKSFARWFAGAPKSCEALLMCSSLQTWDRCIVCSSEPSPTRGKERWSERFDWLTEWVLASLNERKSDAQSCRVCECESAPREWAPEIFWSPSGFKSGDSAGTLVIRVCCCR